MTDYNTKSDAEINELVSAQRHEKLVGDFGNGEFCKTPDYCNNPSDIIPIAIEHGISLIQEKGRKPFALSEVKLEPYQYGMTAEFNQNTCCDDDNPYRALSICYLMMEGE